MQAYQDPIQCKIAALGTIKPSTKEGRQYIVRRVSKIQTLIDKLRAFANIAPDSTVGQCVMDLAVARQSELDRKVWELQN